MISEKIYGSERLDVVNESLKLIQNTKGLTYGTDAFLLAAFIRKAALGSVGCEIGSGTGIVSLLAASKGKIGRIYALEVQQSFAELCERNIELNGLSDRVVSFHGDARNVKPSDFGGELDVVFSNPPYMKTDSGKRNEHDEKYIARHEVCGDIESFCASASRLLRFGGLFYCVYRPDRMAELFSAMEKNSLEPKRMTFVYADSETEPSMMLVESKKGASHGMKITPPLLLHERDTDKSGKRHLTSEAEKIYESCSFENFGKG